ncbi:glucokinase [bacterium SCSIO 12696]|nr:glucokinase [bacterium SCSIO 12696]
MISSLENCLVADVGGTNARFATIDSRGRLQGVEVLATSDYAGPERAIAAYLEKAELKSVSAICFAIACPVKGETIYMPNNHWKFTRAHLEKSLGVPLLLINDFRAQALCLRDFSEGGIQWLGGMRPSTDRMKVIIGPGTGLGVAMITPDGAVLSSEGGHMGFSPSSDHQMALLSVLRRKYHRISLERVISGQGLENLYWANSVLSGEEVNLRAHEVTELAHEGDTLALKTIDDFFEIFAVACGDMALAFGAEGGVYLAGGVMEKLACFVSEESFRFHFEDKGRLADYCAAIPVGVVTLKNPGLLGCYAALRQALVSA